MAVNRDIASLVARLLIAPLFIVFGFEKITGYASSVRGDGGQGQFINFMKIWRWPAGWFCFSPTAQENMR